MQALMLVPLIVLGQSDYSNENNFPNLYNMRYEVELIPQTTNVSCWAAAAAMLVGWRDGILLDPEEIAEGVGYWSAYNHEVYRVDRLLPPDDLNMFEVWNLVPVTQDSLSLEDIATLLWEYGPLWVASSTDIYGNSTLGHVRVVTGISGDGSEAHTQLLITDPWDRNMRHFRESNTGSRYSETAQTFMAKLRRLITSEANGENPNLVEDAIYIAYP